MKITIETIPHGDQRYPTVGDWMFTESGDLVIKVSDMKNWKYEALVGIHELVEVLICKEKGITDEAVTAFDKKFEEMRNAFPDIIGNDEPGNHPKSPYQSEHLAATEIESFVASKLGVNWPLYEKQVNALPEILQEEVKPQ